MISEIKTWVAGAAFWIGALVVVLFFAFAMQARMELAVTKRKLDKAKASIAVYESERAGLKAAIDEQTASINNLASQTVAASAALNLYLAEAKHESQKQTNKIADIRALASTDDCDAIRLRMIDYAKQ